MSPSWSRQNSIVDQDYQSKHTDFSHSERYLDVHYISGCTEAIAPCYTRGKTPADTVLPADGFDHDNIDFDDLPLQGETSFGGTSSQHRWAPTDWHQRAIAFSRQPVRHSWPPVASPSMIEHQAPMHVLSHIPEGSCWIEPEDDEQASAMDPTSSSFENSNDHLSLVDNMAHFWQKRALH